MPDLPLRHLHWRQHLSEARDSRALAGYIRPRTLSGHQERSRPYGLQCTVPAQCGEDRALLPQWKDRVAGACRNSHGPTSTRKDAPRSRYQGDYEIPGDAYRRASERIYRAARIAEEHAAN